MQTADDTLIAYRAAVEDKNDAKTTTIAALRAIVGEIKNDTEYTDALGKKLGIIGENHAVDFANLKPLPKITKTLRGIEIKYSRKQASGVIIYGAARHRNGVYAFRKNYPIVFY